MIDPVLREAINLRDQLLDVAKEFDFMKAAAMTATTAEMRAHDALVCRDAAAMLQKIGTEVSRLREGIGHHHYGKLSRSDLWAMYDTWNGDPQEDSHD